MNKPTGLYRIQDREAPAERKVLHTSAIRSDGAATPRPLERPWPRKIAWREHLRRVKK